MAPSSFLQRAARNFTFSGIGTIASAGIGLLFSGLTIRYLGPARAGYFLALAALSGLNVFLGDLGLGTPAVRRIAILNAEGDLASVRRVIGSVCTASLASAVLVAVPIVLLFARVFTWSRLDPAYYDDAFHATTITMMTFVINQANTPWKSAYSALERFDLLSGLNASFGLAGGLAGIIVLKLVPTMSAIALVRLVLAALRFAADAWCLRPLLKGIPWPGWHWKEISGLLHFGGWVYLGSIGMLFAGRINSLVLTTYLGSTLLPLYELPQRVYGQVHGVLENQSRFLFPMFASYADEAATRIARVEDRLRWMMALTSFALYTGIACVGPALIAHVVGADFAKMVTLPLILACVQGAGEAQTFIPYYTSWGLGFGAPNAIKEIVQGLLVAGTSILLIPRVGFIGASIAQLWTIPVTVGHALWVRRLTASDARVATWGLPLVSPLMMVVSWSGVMAIGAALGWTTHLVPLCLLTAVGATGGLAAACVVEALLFPRADRIATLRSTMLAFYRQWRSRGSAPDVVVAQ